MQSHENKQTCCGSQEAAAERRRSLAPIVRTPRERRSSLLNCAISLDFLRYEGRSELLTFMCTEEISNVAVVVGGGTTPPELRAPRRSRRASMIIVIEVIMMTEG